MDRSALYSDAIVGSGSHGLVRVHFSMYFRDRFANPVVLSAVMTRLRLQKLFTALRPWWFVRLGGKPKL